MAERMYDEVDGIVAAWQHERPDLDLGHMQIVSRVSRISRQLDRRRKAVFAAHGLDVWAFDVLSALRRAGDPHQLSPSALISETLVTSGTMTNRIDRLVTAGWVERRPDPADRRGILVRLTDSGRERVDAALADFLTLEATMLAELGGDEQADLADLLRRLQHGVETAEPASLVGD